MENRRSQARVSIVLDAHLERRVGNSVPAQTRDLCTHGARIVTERPLAVDEELTFDLEVDAGTHLRLASRVLREHHHSTYALRFEHLEPEEQQAIDGFLASLATAPH
jgi:c-di-GMP-binding flagellar brake protein YcgR